MKGMKRYTREAGVENLGSRKDPDCDTCWKRGSCGQARSGSFCTRWQGQKPEPEGVDPNDAWARGDGEAPEG